MTKRIITTVGTSLFTNYMNKDDVVRAYSGLSKEYEQIDTQVKNLEKFDHSKRQDSKYDSDIRHIKDIIQYLWLPFAHEKSCAELQTLQAIAAENNGAELEVYLLATDTVLSMVACELIKTCLDQGNIKGVKKCVFHADANAPDTTVIKGLQMEKADRFRQEGFSNLLNILQKFAVKDNTVLNISGGYKAVIPYLTLYAQLEGIPLKYMYEDSEELITVGNMPFSFDWAKAERYYLILQDGKEYFQNNQQKNNEGAKKLIAEAEQLGLIADKQITELGRLFIDYVRERLSIGKNTLGFLLEYKLLEYLQIYDPAGKLGKVSRSVMIELFPEDADNLPTGNEIDILIEHESFHIYNELLTRGAQKSALPADGSYTSIEVKPLMGTNLKQFGVFLNRLQTIWAGYSPREIRLILYSFLPQDFAKKKFEQSDQWQKHADLVKNTLGAVPFTVQLFNIDIAFGKYDLSTQLMQKPLRTDNMIAERTFVNDILKQA